MESPEVCRNYPERSVLKSKTGILTLKLDLFKDEYETIWSYWKTHSNAIFGEACSTFPCSFSQQL
jgi:hypothetical protein